MAQSRPFSRGPVPGLDRTAQAQFRFATVGFGGEPLEFWIAGWPVDRPLATAARPR
jgi:hypothetical protein